jgi:formate dehydrogenase major subunit
VPGLGARLGRGGATTFEQDVANSDCVVVMGSNMAENHPIAFRFAIKARERGARLIHIDPRFSRTSAMADTYVRIRSGGDIAFLGGLINYVLENELYFKEYVLNYTNATTIIDERFQDTEDLDGLFSGFDPEKRQYDPASWQYAGAQSDGDDNTGGEAQHGLRGDAGGEDMHDAQGDAQHANDAHDIGQAQRGAGYAKQPWPPPRDETLQHPNCVLNITRRHFRRYTPEVVSEICGCSVDEFVAVAKAITENSGPERTTVFCYAMGWTQHTIGVQMIGTAALLQLLLGNIGRPGGGILALRGHATIQGSTDIPTLYNLLPGYLPQPSTLQGHETLSEYLRLQTPKTGWWHNTSKYMVSLLKAWYGDAATSENDYMYDYVPKIGGDYSILPMIQAMKDGKISGLFCMGQNPAVGTQDAHLVRQGLTQLDWLVVRDAFEVESATFWLNSPEARRGEFDPRQIKTEIFLMPAAMVPEKEGSFTNTMRLVQWHDKALESPGDARSEAWFLYHLGQRLKELYKDSDNPRDRGFLALTWDYGMQGPHDEPVIESIVKEVNGWTVADGKLVPGFAALKDDGSTACGCWIYSGIYPAEGQNNARRRAGDDWVSLNWGFAWPANRRILYNRASADPSGKPWSERKKYVWWDAEQGKWLGYDVPDFPVNKAPDTPIKPDGTGIDAHAGSDPFIMMVDGRGWLFVPTGLRDGPLPAHYEPVESPVKNLLYSQETNPVLKRWDRPENKMIAHGDAEYPYVLTTYRLTEHHTAGGMSRFLPWLAELQPHGFVELSVELAGELGIANSDWVVVSTPRGEAEVRALVTERMKPMRIRKRLVHQVGMPWHFGYEGLAKGGIANNLTALVADPNVSIHESKALMCKIRKGRLS